MSNKKYVCEECESEVGIQDSYCGSCGGRLEPVQDDSGLTAEDVASQLKKL